MKIFALYLHYKIKTMTNTNLKNKVISQLIKWGNNENEVIKMVELHFDYAVSKYSTLKTICECIRTIY